MNRNARQDQRGSWYLLTGLLIGIALGVIYAWLIQPVEYIDTAPASLRADYKDKYRALIALAFVADGDLVRARARLALLGEADLYRSVAEQAQRSLAQNASSQEARALGLLALALGQSSSPSAGTAQPATAFPSLPASSSPAASPTAFATVVYTPTLSISTSQPAIGSPSPTSKPTVLSPDSPTPSPAATSSLQPSVTPIPTRPPTATPGAPFVLQSQQQVCDAKLDAPLLKIEAYDAAGKPVPGVQIIITWEGGEERFYTGLKPEVGLGYADFTLLPGVVYTLRLGDGGKPVLGLSAVECRESNGSRSNLYWGAWLLIFKQP